VKFVTIKTKKEENSMSRPTKYRKTSKYPETCSLNSKEGNGLTSINIVFCRPIEITLFSDEVEALKLHNIENLSQSKVAKKMKISQPTIARILKKAYKKITRAILEKKTIQIKNRRPVNSKEITFGPKKVLAIERIEK